MAKDGPCHSHSAAQKEVSLNGRQAVPARWRRNCAAKGTLTTYVCRRAFSGRCRGAGGHFVSDEPESVALRRLWASGQSRPNAGRPARRRGAR